MRQRRGGVPNAGPEKRHLRIPDPDCLGFKQGFKWVETGGDLATRKTQWLQSAEWVAMAQQTLT